MILKKIANYQKLLRKGVLGINRRNADYVHRYNPRHLFPLVDDKLLTKKMVFSSRIATPFLYEVIESVQQVKGLHERLKQYKDFVIKPARGSGGEGILVVNEIRKNAYILSDGSIMRPEDLDYHIFNILGGLFSLGGDDDKALIEYRVKFDPLFTHITHQGVPDIRIIVLLGYPVMAMLRLPTRESSGRANLHQGAVGVGIDLSNGHTMNGVWHHKIINEHPDTGETIANLVIPHWNQVLELAAYSYDLTQLGYLGVDIVLDKDLGPLMLELNARPGLSIQLANNVGLHGRLRIIEEMAEASSESRLILERVNFVKKAFGISPEKIIHPLKENFVIA